MKQIRGNANIPLFRPPGMLLDRGLPARSHPRKLDITLYPEIEGVLTHGNPCPVHRQR